MDPIPDAMLATCRAAWPGVDVAPAELAAFVAARRDPSTPLDRLCVPDLYLACALLRAAPAALRAFETLLAELPSAIAHLDGGSALAEDVLAAVRARVLGSGTPRAADTPAGGTPADGKLADGTPTDGKPADADGKLAAYRGRGDLRGWLRVVAVREALQLLRARRRETPLSDAGDELAARVDDQPPVSADERRVYREAFSAALATLTPRDRNLLRQQYLYGTTIDDLAALYRVHRATAARWLAQIRDTLLRRTRAHVATALRLDGAELDSVMGRLASHLDVSLRHTLSHE